MGFLTLCGALALWAVVEDARAGRAQEAPNILALLIAFGLFPLATWWYRKDRPFLRAALDEIASPPNHY